MCFDVLPPAGVTDSRAWAASLQNGHGFNAVVAPPCPRDKPVRQPDGEWLAGVIAALDQRDEVRRQRALEPDSDDSDDPDDPDDR